MKGSTKNEIPLKFIIQIFISKKKEEIRMPKSIAISILL